jgi:hypothetical protein
MVPIGGPYDGQSRTFSTGGEAADWLVELAAAGYLFPTVLSMICVPKTSGVPRR